MLPILGITVTNSWDNHTVVVTHKSRDTVYVKQVTESARTPRSVTDNKGKIQPAVSEWRRYVTALYYFRRASRGRINDAHGERHLAAGGGNYEFPSPQHSFLLPSPRALVTPLGSAA
ncbi:unnamed protein product, partial [Iphiclides podalirius]